MSDIPVHPKIAMRVYQNLLDAVAQLPAIARYEMCLFMADDLPPKELADLRQALEKFAHGGRLRLVQPENPDG